MPAAGAVLIVAVVLIVLALVYYLVATIVALRQIVAGLDETIAGVGEIVEKTAPVEEVVTTINQHLDAAVDALEGLLVKKAGMEDAVGLVDGLYPGAAAAGFRNFAESPEITPPRISEVYTRGTLTLARLGREAPIAVASPAGPALRNVPIRQPGRPRPLPGDRPRPLAGHRHGLPRPARGHRCRPRHRLTTSGPPAWTARSARCATPAFPTSTPTQTTSTGFTTGGARRVRAHHHPVVALQGSGTADAPYLRLARQHDRGRRPSAGVRYNVRDIDGTADNAVQQVAPSTIRVGTAGAWTNVAAAYIADATTGPNLATQVTPLGLTLPAAVDNQASAASHLDHRRRRQRRMGGHRRPRRRTGHRRPGRRPSPPPRAHRARSNRDRRW